MWTTRQVGKNINKSYKYCTRECPHLAPISHSLCFIYVPKTFQKSSFGVISIFEDIKEATTRVSASTKSTSAFKDGAIIMYVDKHHSFARPVKTLHVSVIDLSKIA